MYKVMIVDDEPIVKVAFRSMLDWEAEGFSIVETAANGEEALRKIEECEPDIVITDLKMPIMNGIELIEALNKKNYDGKVIVVSNFGEYELVREALTHGAVDYMLKISMKKEELIQQLNKAITLLEKERSLYEKKLEQSEKFLPHMIKARRIVLRDFFEGTACEGEDVRQIREIGISQNLEASYISYLSFETHQQEGSKHISSAQVESLIKELIGYRVLTELIPMQNKSILLILSEKEIREKYGDIESLLTKLGSIFNTYITQDITISYAGPVKEYEGARSCYLQCKEAIQMKFYGKRNMIEASKINIMKKSFLSQYIVMANQLIQMSKEETSEKMKVVIDNMMEEAEENLWDPKVLKEVCCSMIEYIHNSLVETKGASYECLEKVKEKINGAADSQVLKEMLFTYCTSYSKYLAEGRGKPEYREEINQTIQYIYNQIGNKITLKMIAEHVNLNESYLCRIFKEEVGQGIVQFITEVKMEKAAQLMKNKNKYIKEIAQEIGIENQFYFNKLFKKYFGTTPTEYKNNIRNR